MKRMLSAAALLGVSMLAQNQLPIPEGPPGKSEDVRLPNGKSQREEILKADYAKNLTDAQEMARLATEVKDEVEKNQPYTVSVKTLKKLDDIGRLSRNIHGRLNRY